MAGLILPGEMLVFAEVEGRGEFARLHPAYYAGVYAYGLLHLDVVVEAVGFGVGGDDHVSGADEAGFAVAADYVRPVLEDAQALPCEAGVDLGGVVHPNGAGGASGRAGAEGVAFEQDGILDAPGAEVVEDARAHHSAADDYAISRNSHVAPPFSR